MNKNSFVKYFMLIFCIGKIFGDESILSSLKKREFEIDLKKSVVESQKLHDSWINPINMSYIFDKSNQLGKFSDTRIFKITIDQPIFKSGGIYFAIKYANASKKYFSLSVKEAEKELTAKALSLLYSYKKTKLLIKKQKLLIANAKIDVIRKKEQYLNGLVDSSFLDQALLNKNQAELRLIELISSLKEIYENFKNISDKNPDSLKMPIFRLIEKRDFLKNNLGILKSNEDKNVKEYFLDWIDTKIKTYDSNKSVEDVVERVSAYPGNLGKFLTYIPGSTPAANEGNFDLVQIDGDYEEITAFRVRTKQFDGTIEVPWTTADSVE